MTGFSIGEPVPWFSLATAGNPDFKFHAVAGRYVALFFLGSTRLSVSEAALRLVEQHRDLFDDTQCCFFGVSIDSADQGQLRESLPGIRYFWDLNGAVSHRFGALAVTDGQAQHRPFWLILDPQLRVLAAFSAQQTAAVMSFIATLPAVTMHAGVPVTAPVLVLPRVFEPDFCRQLIAAYHAGEPRDSGFMREVDGKTVGVIDHAFKRRHDVEIDGGLREEAKRRIERRLLPEIAKAFQFQATRMERYLVACYDSQKQGFFGAHRDNTTKGTAHRRFAVTINLNAEEFEGGELLLPEFGTRTYRAPTGGAVVFSCSLLHEARPVTQGVRYAFLPFLYDEAGAELREANLKYLQTTSP